MKLRALGKEERKEAGKVKEWARGFYASKAWDETRKAYMIAQHGLCERCGEPAKIVHHKRHITQKNINNTDITLNWDNLEALCQDCHNKEHHAGERQKRYMFDEAGNVIKPPPLIEKN